MVDRPAHLIFIRPLSTSGLLPAARAPSQDPPGIQNPRIVLLSDSISSGDGGGGGYLVGHAESLVLSGHLWTLFLPFQLWLPTTSPTLCREGYRLWIYKPKTSFFRGITV